MDKQYQIIKDSLLYSLNKPSLISIVIPVFNREDLINDCLKSALSQNFSKLEIIVIDNSSTDNTIKNVMNLVKYDERVKVIRNIKNVGPVKNWLLGVQFSTGMYTKILFSDDILIKNSLEKFYKIINPEIGFVASSCLVGKSPKHSKKIYYLPGEKSIYRSEFLLARYAITRSFIVSPCAALFRKTDLEASLIKSINLPICEESIRTGAGPDLRIYLDTLRKYPYFGFLHQPSVFFRSHEGSFTIGKESLKVNLGYKKTFDYEINKSSFLLKQISKLHFIYRILSKFYFLLKRHVFKKF